MFAMHRNGNKSEAQVDKIEPDVMKKSSMNCFQAEEKNIEGNQ